MGENLREMENEQNLVFTKQRRSGTLQNIRTCHLRSKINIARQKTLETFETMIRVLTDTFRNTTLDINQKFAQKNQNLTYTHSASYAKRRSSVDLVVLAYATLQGNVQKICPVKNAKGNSLPPTLTNIQNIDVKFGLLGHCFSLFRINAEKTASDAKTSKTVDYHRNIFRPPTLLQIVFRKTKTLFL